MIVYCLGVEIMFKLLLILSILFFVTGCGRTLAGEAVEQARVAIELGDYSRGSLLLVKGCNDLHAQSVYLIHMVNYQNRSDLLGMVRSWVGIYAIDASEDFVQEAAYEILSTTLAGATIVDRQ